ncbi:MAG TPA: IS21 family transposase [Vicinamibacteria bacterium]|nr:IS21 family transposase [Vicinamibacteria bacterium]
MISKEQVVEIRRLYYAEHWRVGTIAFALGIHHDTVRRALGLYERAAASEPRKTKTQPYEEFLRQTLERYPKLRATRLYDMIWARGYTGGIAQVRRVVKRLRPSPVKAYARVQVFAGEQGQVDWAHFGVVRVGRAMRRLSCFVLTLSYSRAFYLEFFFDQSLENFVTGHVRALHDLGGCPRSLLYDNLKAVVVERLADKVRFHPKLLELCAHYHFQPIACTPGRANEKGRVERTIRFIRESFFEARSFTNLADFNRKALEWRDHVLDRPHPELKPRRVIELFDEEKTQLLPLPAKPFTIDFIKPVRSKKPIYIRFDLNDYSIPPSAVGQNLLLAASDTRVRFLLGDKEVATHPRSYSRDELIEDPAHRKALMELRRRAQSSSAMEQLRTLVPEAERFVQDAFEKGESPRGLVQKLLMLLDDYGKDEVRDAIRVALERQSPRLSSLAWLLNQRRRTSNQKRPLPLQLGHRPELTEVFIEPHDPEVYDELFDDDHDPSDR